MTTQSHQHARRRSVALVAKLSLAAVGLSVASVAALAQTAYPNRPIRLVLPYPPGGGTDIVARLLSQKMTQSMGQPVIVDNKPGASTIIGTDQVAKAAPDGYTIGLITDSHAINPTFFPKLPYDSVKDFAPVTQLVQVPLVLVVNPALNVKTLPEFIALAKKSPGKINYASIGNGTPHQLAMEWLKSLTGIFVTHIPYRGVGPALTDVVAGQVDAMFTGTSTAAPYVRQGRLVALAMSSGNRQPSYPDTPAIAEAGPALKNFDFKSWYGIVAPAGTPRDIVMKLNRELTAALDQPDVKERLSSLGVIGSPSSPEQFSAFLRKESESLAELVRRTGVKPD